MAASCIEYDIHTNTGSFSISEIGELDKLPTTKRNGNEELRNVKPLNAGSTCIVIENSSVYMLDGDDDTWKEI